MRVRDPLQVDEGVPAAVEEHLAAVLRERTADAADADPDFASDVADRVAAFALGGGRRLRAEFLWWALRGSGGGAPRRRRPWGSRPPSNSSRRAR